MLHVSKDATAQARACLTSNPVHASDIYGKRLASSLQVESPQRRHPSETSCEFNAAATPHLTVH